ATGTCTPAPARPSARKGPATMASISHGPNGRRTIQFVAPDGKRKTIRLGKVSQKTAEGERSRVEHRAAALASGTAWAQHTASWVRKVGDDLAGKLAAVRLIPVRNTARLGEFIDGYLESRADTRPSTRCNMRVARDRLVQHFGPDRDMSSITPGEADAWHF